MDLVLLIIHSEWLLPWIRIILESFLFFYFCCNLFELLMMNSNIEFFTHMRCVVFKTFIVLLCKRSINFVFHYASSFCELFIKLIIIEFIISIIKISFEIIPIIGLCLARNNFSHILLCLLAMNDSQLSHLL